MISSQLRWARFLLLLAIIPMGCGWSDVLSGPSLPEYRPPTAAQIEEMTERMMGKGPPKPVPVTTDGVEVVFQTGHAGGIHALALSPNGRYIASSGSQDGSVKIWDVASGQEIRNFTGFGDIGQSVDQLAFSKDSTRIVAHELRGQVKVFDVASGRELRTLGSILGGGAAISNDGHFAAVSDHGAQKSTSRMLAISVIDIGTGGTVWTLPDSELERPIAISTDGKTLVTVSIDTGMRASSGFLGTIGSYLGVDDLFTPSQPTVPEIKQELRIWDVPGKKLRRKMTYPLQSIGHMLSPDGRYLVGDHHAERAVRVIDLETGTVTTPIAMGDAALPGAMHAIAFSPDGKLLAVAKNTELVKLYEFASGREVKRLTATSINFSPDGTVLVIASMSEGAPYLQQISTGKETHLAGGISAVSDLAVTPDGRSVVAGMNGGSAKSWDLTTGQLLRTYDCPDGMGVSSIAVNKRNQLATACVNGSAWLWDLTTGNRVRNLAPPLPPDQFVPAVVRMTPDGRAAVIGLGNQLVVSDLSSGKELRRITLPDEALPATFEKMANPSTDDEKVDPKMRAVLKGQPSIDPQMLEQMKKTTQWLRSIAIHPNGRLAAIGRSFSTNLWDLETGKQVLQFRDISRREAKARQQRLREQQYRQALEEAKSPRSLLPFGLGGRPRAPSKLPNSISAEDLSDEIDDLDEGQGAQSLAFSPDGRFLLSDGVRGKTLWDVATGRKVAVPKKPVQPGADPMRLLSEREFNPHGAGVAFSSDGTQAARGHGQLIMVWDVETEQERVELVGHTGTVSSLAFSVDGRLLLSGGSDGTLRVWDLQKGKELAALIALGREDFVAVTPDQYYRASKSRIKGVAFRVNSQLFPFDQFDLRFNRPDIVLQRLGLASPDNVQGYRLAYEKRLKKMGLTEQMLGNDFHLPEVAILTNDVPVSLNQTALVFRVKASDSKYTLDRLNVFVNDIPIHGTQGLALPDKQVHTYEQEVQVPLVPGRNKIQVSVLNQQGTESLRQTVYTTSTAEAAPPDVYVVAIGVSEYKNRAYNLRYAAKDAKDLLSTYKALEQRVNTRSKVHVLSLTDQRATQPEILKAKAWLKQAKVNDLVVVFAAGHGMTDEQSNYYFGTYDIDPKHPATNGLPYEEFENLLDGIPALQKVLLLDTCFSGEIDKDQAVIVAKAETRGMGTVKMRAFKPGRGVSVVADPDGTAASPQLSTDMLKFQQDWFADLRRGTGAAVISSSSGNEYSLEGEQWKNGVFTYALLQGLKNRAADANKDDIITVSELQAYVIEEVRKLTAGGQNPTVRRENLEYDFAVY
jgi:WD40 repeat protein